MTVMKLPAMTLPARRGSRAAGLVMGLVLALTLSACGGDDIEEITVLHGPVPAPTVMAAGDGAPAVGDVRLFHFAAETADGDPVLVDWIMTTTAIDQPEAGVESRINTGAFSFGDTNDQIVIEGVALYPAAGAVLEVGTEQRRVIVGGSGRYAGVDGEVVSIQAQDGSWQHRFLIDR